MSGDVNKSVILTLKVVADPGNAKVTAATTKSVKDGVAAQVTEFAKATAAAEKESLKQAAAVKRAAEANAKQFDMFSEKATAMSRGASRKIIEVGGAFLQVAQGVATLGILTEETTEGMLRGLVKVQGGFQIVQGLGKSYLDLTEAAHGFAKASEAAAAAQKLLATYTGVQTAATVAGGTAAVGGVAAAGGAAAAGGTATAAGAAAGGTAVAAAATAAKTAMLGVVTAFGAVVAVGGAIALAGQEIGAQLGLWESFTGAITKWHTEAKTGAQVARDLAATEAAVAKSRTEADRRNQRQGAEADRNQQNAGFRGTLSSLAIGASGGTDKEKIEKERANNEKEREIIQRQLADSKGKMAQEEAQAKAGGQYKQKEARTWGSYMMGGAAQREGEGRTWAGYMRGQSADAEVAKRGPKVTVSREGVDRGNQAAAANLEKMAQTDQRRLETARALEASQKEALSAARGQYETAVQTLASEKARHQSALAQFGAMTSGEQAQLARILDKNDKQEKFTKAEIKFLKERNLLNDQTTKQEAEKGDTEVGRRLAEAQGTQGGGLGVAAAQTGADEAYAAMNSASAEVAKTTAEIAKQEAEFVATLQRLKEAMQIVSDASADKAGVQRQDIDAGATEAVGQAGAGVASATVELKDAMVAALDQVEASLREATEAVAARGARGSANRAVS